MNERASRNPNGTYAAMFTMTSSTVMYRGQRAVKLADLLAGEFTSPVKGCKLA